MYKSPGGNNSPRGNHHGDISVGINETGMSPTTRLIEGQYMLTAPRNSATTCMEIQLIDGTAEISIALSAVAEDKGRVAQMLHATIATW